MKSVMMLVVAGACVGALGQGRLPPPPEQREGGASERIENLGEFLSAYKRSGRPRMLVYSDLVGVSGGTGKALNDQGMMTRLGARLEQQFRDPQVVLLNAEATGLLTQQQRTELSRNEEYAAAKMVGERAKADVVVYVRMMEQGARRDGAAYAASYVVADLRRGTTIGSHSWDMTPDPADRGEFTTHRMQEYARAIARRVAEDFSSAFPEGGSVAGGRAFTLRVVGDYEDDDVAAFKEAVQGIKRVQDGSVMQRDEEKGHGQSVVSFEMFYSGDITELRRDARRAAVNAMGMEAVVLGSREGEMSLRLAPLAMSARERMLSGGADSEKNKDEREKLRAAYAGAGSPTIAFMINQAVVESEAPLAGEDVKGAAPVQSGEVNIMLGERIGLGDFDRSRFLERVVDREMLDVRKERRQDAVIDTVYFENSVVERFVRLGMTPRDVSAAQGELTKGDAGAASKSWSERELAADLARRSGADLALSGVGRLVRERGTGRPLRIIFTTRVFSVKDGNVVAAASVQRDVSSGFESINQSVEELTAEATGKLAAQLADKWGAAKAQP